MSKSQHSTNAMYTTVIDRVIKSLTATFFDNNIHHEILKETKALWLQKIKESDAVTDFEGGGGAEEEDGAEMDFDYFLPPNPATLVTIVTQFYEEGKCVEITVPAGAIQSGKIKEILKMKEITDLMDSAKINEDTADPGIKEQELMTKKVQERVDQLLKELGYAFEAPKKRKPRTKKKAGAAKKPKKAASGAGGKGRGRKKKVVVENEEEEQEIVFVVDDNEGQGVEYEIEVKEEMILDEGKEEEHEEEMLCGDSGPEDDEDILSDEIENDLFDNLNLRNLGNLRIPQGDGGIDEIDSPFEEEDDEEVKEMEKFKLEAIERIKSDNEKLYGTENVMICQYEKVVRRRNQWKFVLRDGIVKVNGKDYVFGRATGQTVDFA